MLRLLQKHPHCLCGTLAAEQVSRDEGEGEEEEASGGKRYNFVC